MARNSPASVLLVPTVIGDLAGAKVAYLAFQKAEQKTPPDVDGFTPDQQFFIAWGQFPATRSVRCSRAR